MLQRVIRSLNARGFWPTVKLAAQQPRLYWRERSFTKERLTAQAEYDRRHNVDTGSIIYLGDLGIVSGSAVYGTRYGPTGQSAFRNMMAELAIDHAHFTFVDIGSGKGAVLFYASDWPFNRIIGIELATALHEIANKNISTYRSDAQRCFNIQSINEDASKFTFPDNNLILYLSSPFGLKIMRVVFDNIMRSFMKRKRDVYLVYNNIGYSPEVDSFLEQARDLCLIVDRNTYRIFQVV